MKKHNYKYKLHCEDCWEKSIRKSSRKIYWGISVRKLIHYIMICLNRILRYRIWLKGKEPKWPKDYGY